MICRLSDDWPCDVTHRCKHHPSTRSIAARSSRGAILPIYFGASDLLLPGVTDLVLSVRVGRVCKFAEPIGFS